MAPAVTGRHTLPRKGEDPGSFAGVLPLLNVCLFWGEIQSKVTMPIRTEVSTAWVRSRASSFW